MWWAYVGYDNGSNSVLYYSTDTCKILSSQNFRFLTQTTTPPATNDIELDPAPEGEERDRAPVQITDELNENGKHKIEENFVQKTRGKQVNFWALNDPFPDKLDEQGNLIVDSDNDQVYAITAGDEHKGHEGLIQLAWMAMHYGYWIKTTPRNGNLETGQPSSQHHTDYK